MANLTQMDYLDAALKLLPVGLAWNRSPDSNMGKILSIRAEQLVQVNETAHQLVKERMLSNAFLLLDDWEVFMDYQNVLKSIRLKHVVPRLNLRNITATKKAR